MYATSMAFIEDSAPQKIRATISSRRFFAALASTNAGMKNCKEKKKDELPPAIGKNYINKMFLFF